MTYSIWIIPPEPFKTRLQTVINELEEKYQAPKFTPHLTVLTVEALGFEQFITQIKPLTHDISPLQLKLGPISFSTTEFQCVFVRVNSTAALLELNLKAKRLLKADNDVYMPHMSLLYGNYDMQTREKIAAEIEPISGTFQASELTIIEASTEDPSTWKEKTVIQLQPLT